jgi:hypothetical protein
VHDKSIIVGRVEEPDDMEPWTCIVSGCASYRVLDYEALHPYWPPDHDYGTLDEMPMDEIIITSEGETVTRRYVIEELDDDPRSWRVIARPNYDPRVALGLNKESTDDE